MDSQDRLDQGWAALDACDWDAARSHFEAASHQRASPDVLHGLGLACYWSGDYPCALETLQASYVGYRESGALQPAGRIATQLAMLYGLIEGNATAAGGWAEHASRALEHAGDCVEAGWLALLRACFTSDPIERAEHATRALAIGRRCGDPGVEFDALAYLGLAHVELGELERGLPLVDEALAAVSGAVVTDPWATAEILCVLFHSCEIAVDLGRAEGWLAAVEEHVNRTGELPTYGICRTHYGGLLVSAGRWTDAERELAAALAIANDGFRGSRSDVILRLADLRARQGRHEEARRLLAGHEDQPEAAAVLARLYLAEGDPRAARAVLRRFLDRRGRGRHAATHLALLIEAELADGQQGVASELADELSGLAGTTQQPLIDGLALLSAGRVAAHRDLDEATGLLERAIDVFSGADLRSELAHTHLELARLHLDTNPQVARMEARAALNGFEHVGSSNGADAAAAVLRSLGDGSRSWPRAAGDLTDRETQVLQLLAEGAANADIAARLYISVRTVEHHVSNILAKLGVDNRTEAAAVALRTGVSPNRRGSQPESSGPPST